MHAKRSKWLSRGRFETIAQQRKALQGMSEIRLSLRTLTYPKLKSVGLQVAPTALGLYYIILRKPSFFPPGVYLYYTSVNRTPGGLGGQSCVLCCMSQMGDYRGKSSGKKENYVAHSHFNVTGSIKPAHSLTQALLHIIIIWYYHLTHNHTD